MHVLEVIPVRRGMSRESLSYFSNTPYERGTVLSIPLRNGVVSGVVIECTEASTAKTALRAATFSLRKVPAQDNIEILPRSILKTVDHLAAYHAASPGAVLFSLLPQNVLRNPEEGIISLRHPPSDEQEHVHRVLQKTTEERYVYYQSIVREAFAGRASVVLVAPTIADIHYAKEVLGGGIKEHVITFYGALGTKALSAAYERLHDVSHPKLIIATPQYGILERNDISTVILEHSRGKGYHGQHRPYLDFKKAFLTHSALLNRKVVSGDTLISTEDEWQIREKFAESFDEHTKRIDLPGKLDILEVADKPDGSTPFYLFSKKLLKAIKTALDKKENIFLFAARRGLAPIVACGDCSHILRAPESGAPLSLHRKIQNGKEERWLFCSVSGYRERAPDLCPVCGSWRLKERGIGIQYVYDELKKHIKENKIVLFDHTTANTPKKAEELQTKFYDTKGCILLGTALALPYLKKPVAFSAITSMDALRAIPTWRGQEEMLAAVLSLREATRGTVLVQTRGGDNVILEYAKKGSVASFYDDELHVREQYNYPPYTTFIHLTWQGSKKAVDGTTKTVKSLFSDDGIALYGLPSTGSTEDGEKVSRQGLIRVSAHLWPHEYIIEKIKMLPPSVRVIINPDRII